MSEFPGSCLALPQLCPAEDYGQQGSVVGLLVVPQEHRCGLPPTCRRDIGKREVLSGRGPGATIRVEASAVLLRYLGLGFCPQKPLAKPLIAHGLLGIDGRREKVCGPQARTLSPDPIEDRASTG